MRNLNVLKHRKILIDLQKEISKENFSINFYTNKKLTDFERGEIQGQRKAYKNILKILHKYIEYADVNWNYIDNHVRRNETFLLDMEE